MEKRFYRSREDKKLAGVCGGIAEYFEVDPTLVRLIWVVFTFVGGAGVIAYIIAAIIMPEKPMDISEDETYIEIEEVDEEELNKEEGTATFQKPRDHRSDNRRNEPKGDNNNVAIGLALVVLGSLFFSRNFLRIHWIDFSYIWPVALILIGVYVIVNQRK